MIVFLSGVTGFVVIEGYNWADSFYMTVITIATVGYGEVVPLSDVGRMFTSILILANLGVLTYAVTISSQYIFDGEYKKDINLYRMKKDISELEDHVILCGLGRNGRTSLQTLNTQGIPVVVIETRKERIEQTETPVRYFLNGDSTKDEILIEAGIRRARALITTLPDDADNVFTVLTARELNPSLRIISRASLDTSLPKLRRAGANNIIMPDKLGGAHMAALVSNPDVSEFVEIMSSLSGKEFMIREIETSSSMKLIRAQLLQKTGATVLGIRKSDGSYVFNPGDDIEILKGCRIIAMGSEIQLEQLITRLNE
jgi:voltage-gated potassium channel